MLILTLLVTQVVKIELKGIIITRFRVDHQGAVDGFNTGIRAVSAELVDTSPVKGDSDNVSLLGVGSDMESHAIEVSEGDINGLPLRAVDPLFDHFLQDTVVGLQENHVAFFELYTKRKERRRSEKRSDKLIRQKELKNHWSVFSHLAF